MRLAALALFASALCLAGCGHPQPVYGPPPPSIAPGAAYQQGQHDGFEGARHDVADGRPPSYDHHPRYRNPPVPPPVFRDYRQGFREGYNQFLHQGPPPQGAY